ncbi:hypothetical protein GUITHDRAFT_84428 [Guillardia theta CCMP2712]|uniref:Anaphase-promoting complex subunit 4 WD40 domain-containing protein n=1 Tax=Guillardia theta (strain CCMP2712) TaxID=905079 RepID=L1JYN5_GUITC|nr:hypothetical protein GUITHDRAFT_84428 [Guillardia theta CCMP2712]EKX53449.1 hypothetical protein GUITHDRAFT_84428 [Guillardia theta CCMP2712]|eukprot:XP_005840429.1 hypothetical protein GUITHDRAFT_84428 [Guillardia theta CCMP2712]
MGETVFSNFRENNLAHKGSICLLAWSPCGSRLLSTDKNGLLAVWKPEERGIFVQQSIIQKGQSAVTHITFRSKKSMKSDDGDAPTYYFAGEDGIVYYGSDDKTKVQELFRLESPDGGTSGIAALVYYEEADELIAINEHMMMKRISGPDDSGQIKEISSGKIAAKSLHETNVMMRAIWISSGLLMTSSGENLLRFWKLSEDENYVLRVSDPKVPPDDKIHSVAYSEKRRILCAGTSKGYVLFWSHNISSSQSSSADDWYPMLRATVKLGMTVIDLQWAKHHGFLSASTDKSVHILVENELQRKVRDQVAMVQISNKHLGFLPNFWAGNSPLKLTEVECGVPIKGCDITKSNILVWSGRKAEVYEINSLTNHHTFTSSFNTNATTMVIGSYFPNEPLYIYMANDSEIEVANLEGTITKRLPVEEVEGEPVYLDCHGTWLVASTSKNYIHIWDVSTTKRKSVLSRKFEEGDVPIADIVSVKINSMGSKVSILARGSSDASKAEIVDTKIWVFDVVSDSFYSYEFGPDYYPVNHFWDTADITEGKKENEIEKEGFKAREKAGNLLGCEIKYRGEMKDFGAEIFKINRAEVVTFFATTEKGLLLQDRFPITSEGSVLLGLQIPHLFLSAPKSDEATGNSTIQIQSKVLRDFVGMELVNFQTRWALLEFSYNLTLGNMDEAYKAVKLIKGPNVWKNMAHMCVKTSRLDVAEVCLSNMGDAKGARAVRLARQEKEREAQIAMVAIQLGLIEDAERLYVSCGRYDLLNKMYQACGLWEKAVETAQKKDRINLKGTYYAWGRYLENVGDHKAAIACYEKADAHRTEVPRMFYEMKDISSCEEYVRKANDKVLFGWMAKYFESKQKLDVALNYYKQAEDFMSIVRIRCFQRNFEAAEEVVNESGSGPAAYYLASQYEAMEKPKDAIRLFSKSGRYNHAVRLARENGLDKELLPLAIRCNKRVMLECAKYLEERQMYEQAVVLYKNGGNSSRALQICFDAKLFDSLRAISDDLGSDTDPDLLQKVGDFFMSHSQYDKAVQLFVTCKQPKHALELCEKYKVEMTETMAEKITELLPEKEADAELRNSMLKRIADICVQQQNYHLATKKYTQAGMKDKAMDALLKSGDTEKIIFFAGVLRSKEIYIRAANYLQTQNWHTEPEIMKKIIEFYNKAKAYKQLGMFYDSCSQVEIDEYRDYEKALDALKESKKYLVKADEDCTMLDRRIQLIEVFVRAKSLVKDDPNEFVQTCYQLLETPKLDVAVQVGDVFALLIEFFFSEQDFQQCYQLIEKMRQRRILLGPYLDQSMVDTIYRKMNIHVPADNDEVDEEIDSDM